MHANEMCLCLWRELGRKIFGEQTGAGVWASSGADPNRRGCRVSLPLADGKVLSFQTKQVKVIKLYSAGPCVPGVNSKVHARINF